MNSIEFMWHAKRGHGTCIDLVKENPSRYFTCVKKIVLNNYAFLLNGEYRSAYAYKLASFYNCSKVFIEIIVNKLNKIDITNDYESIYLLNNLYFYNISEYISKLLKIIRKWLNKSAFTEKENNTINSSIDLLLDQKVDIKTIKHILFIHFDSFPNSNLVLSCAQIAPINYHKKEFVIVNLANEYNEKITEK